MHAKQLVADSTLSPKPHVIDSDLPGGDPGVLWPLPHEVLPKLQELGVDGPAVTGSERRFVLRPRGNYPKTNTSGQ